MNLPVANSKQTSVDPARVIPWGRYLATFGRGVLLAVLTVLFLIPFYIVFRNALLIQKQITSFDWIWLPIPPYLGSWNDLFTDSLASMAGGLRNSAIIATLQTIGQLLFASMGGYALARIPFRWRNQVFYFVLITLMVPMAAIFVPMYVVVAGLGWVNTLQGIIVPNLFNVFALFVFRQFYMDFPRELEDAGRVDGLSHLGVFWYLVLPNSSSILIAMGSIAFINSWNDFLWPLLIGQGPNLWTVQVVLSTFLTAQTINLPALFMGAAVSIVPLLILFLFLQRYIVEGAARSAIKG